MTIKREGKKIPVEENGYLSDESDFYGDELTKQELEAQAESFNVRKWWAQRSPTLMSIASQNLLDVKAKKPAKLYNPYTGFQYSRQLDESVEEFIQRVPPATTQIPAFGYDPWIRIANPYYKSTGKSERGGSGSGSGSGDVEEEGPSDEDTDTARFLRLGVNLLQELTGLRHSIEKENVGKAKAVITRAVNVEKEKIVKRLLNTAIECRCTTGKWMIFSPVTEVNDVWSIIAKATASNDLGIAAKTAPDEGEPRKERLICIYTHDFTDMEDITRVAQKLKDLGLIKSDRGIWYKCDAYSYLQLTSRNEYNIKASLYNSNDVLAKKGEKKDTRSIDFTTTRRTRGA